MKIESDADRLIIISAFRYAIGRPFLSSVLSPAIVGSWDDLTPGDQELIHREIKQAASNGKIGDSLEYSFWDVLLELPVKESCSW